MSRRPSPLTFSNQDLSLLKRVLVDRRCSKEQKLCAQVLLAVFERQNDDVIWYMDDLARIFLTTRRTVVQILNEFRTQGCEETIKTFPKRRSRSVTSEAMLDYLQKLLSQENSIRLGHRWTLQDLVLKMTQAGFPCSTFSISQAQRIIERQRHDGRRASSNS